MCTPPMVKVGIQSEYAHDLRMYMLSHSLKAVYAIPNAIARIATRQNLCCGQSTAHVPINAAINETRAINRSPPVQCTTAKARSAKVPLDQIVNKGS